MRLKMSPQPSSFSVFRLFSCSCWLFVCVTFASKHCVSLFGLFRAASVLHLARDVFDEFGLNRLLLAVVFQLGWRQDRLQGLGFLFKNPLHPSTQGVLHSMPKLGQSEHKRLPTIEGMVPDLLHLPTGCSFYDRCPKRMDHCKSAEPPLLEVSPGHKVACYLYSAPPAV